MDAALLNNLLRKSISWNSSQPCAKPLNLPSVSLLGGYSATNSNVISGIASKDPLNGSNVCAYAIVSGVKAAAVGSCATNIVNGNYSIDLGTYTGQVLLEAKGGNYTDEATGTSAVLGIPLRSVLNNVTGSTSVYVENTYQSRCYVPEKFIMAHN